MRYVLGPTLDPFTVPGTPPVAVPVAPSDTPAVAVLPDPSIVVSGIDPVKFTAKLFVPKYDTAAFNELSIVHVFLVHTTDGVPTEPLPTDAAAYMASSLPRLDADLSSLVKTPAVAGGPATVVGSPSGLNLAVHLSHPDLVPGDKYIGQTVLGLVQ